MPQRAWRLHGGGDGCSGRSTRRGVAAYPSQDVLRRVLLGSDQAVIDEAEASAAATSEGDLEAVEQDA